MFVFFKIVGGWVFRAGLRTQVKTAKAHGGVSGFQSRLRLSAYADVRGTGGASHP